MEDRGRSLQEILDDLLPEADLERLGQKIGSRLPSADFRQQVRTIIEETINLPPHPWAGLGRRCARVTKAAETAAAALRELDEALDDMRYGLTRKMLTDAREITAIDLNQLADRLDKLLPVDESVAGPEKEDLRIPRQNDLFEIFVERAARLFRTATGKRPTIAVGREDGCYTGNFFELVMWLWRKVVAVADATGRTIYGPRDQKNDAIGQATQRALRCLKRMDTYT